MSLNSFKRTAKGLDFNPIRQELANLCVSHSGKTAALQLCPPCNRAKSERLLNLTHQLLSILSNNDDPLPRTIKDPSPVIIKVRKGLLPEPEDIRNIIPFWNAIERLSILRNTLSPQHQELCLLLEPLDPMEDEQLFFATSFGDDGKVMPTATALLMELEQRINSLKKNIQIKTETILKREDVVPMLRDSYITLRNDRMVVPIRAEFKNVFLGIIHGISGTDKTAFMEPQELVRDNNELAEAIAEREAEVARILRQAAEILLRECHRILKNYELIGEVDLIKAKGKLGQKLSGTRPKYNNSGKLLFTSLKNPLMMLHKQKVKSNRLEMAEHEQTLVISGPNAGGKTVLLKSAGLAVIMSACGILPPIGEGSTLPYPNKIFAVVGDEQSLEDGQSTFSAQLVAIKDSLESCGKGDWVMIDEILNGTDPGQAGALALTVLEQFQQSGCRCFVSTHLPQLKIEAQKSDVMVNGAMGFGEDGKPTYILEKGHPGISYPLAIAASIGLPADLIERARLRLDSSQDDYQKAIEELQAKADAAEKQRQQLSDELQVAKQNSEELEKLKKDMQEAEANFERDKKQILKEEVRKKKSELSQMVKDAHKADKRGMEKAHAKVDKMETELVREIKRPEALPIENVQVGGDVWIIPLDRKARLEKILPDGKMEISSGGMRLTLAVEELIGIKSGAKQQEKKQNYTATNNISTAAGHEISLMGLRFEEAIAKLEPEFDKQLLSENDTVRVVHGKGILKEKVLAWFDSCGYVATYRPAMPNEGGDGASIVTLA